MNLTDRNGVTLHRYLKEDGSFDYEGYRAVQIAGNKRKIMNVWVIERNIAFLADYIKKTMGAPKFGLCHGTRRGKEQEWFRKYLGCEVIGTEIADTALDFPNTIQWDFHVVKPEWIDAVDFIYSNSLDHSYDPELCLNAWMSCIRENGICILEHTLEHDSRHTSKLDCFGADFERMLELIREWGESFHAKAQRRKGEGEDTSRRPSRTRGAEGAERPGYYVLEVLEAPGMAKALQFRYIVIKRAVG
jgi:hypothetical protein